MRVVFVKPPRLAPLMWNTIVMENDIQIGMTSASRDLEGAYRGQSHVHGRHVSQTPSQS